MLDEVWSWGEGEYDNIGRKLLDNALHFINDFELRWTLSADQIHRLRNRVLCCGSNSELLAEIQRDIMSYKRLRTSTISEDQYSEIEEGLRNTFFYEALKSLWNLEKDIYKEGPTMLREAIDIINWKRLLDISTIAEGIRKTVELLLQSRWYNQ